MSGPPTNYVEGFHCLESVYKTKYHQLGETDMHVSALSLGSGPFGGLYGEIGSGEVGEIVDFALRNGVNFIDTAYWYGQGRSESRLGQVLARIPRKSYYIATKVGRYELDQERMFDFRAERVVQSVDASLRRLGLPYVDLIQIHDLEFAPDLSVILNETLPALEKIRQCGKARYIGITGYPLAALKMVLDKSRVKIDTVLSYSRGTLIDDSLVDFAQELTARGVGVINAAPNAMGLLTNSGPPDWHPAADEIKLACRKAAEFCQLRSVELAHLALQYSLALPYVSTTLVGVTSLDQLKTNLNVSWSPPTSSEVDCLAELRGRILQPVQNQHWEKSFWSFS